MNLNVPSIEWNLLSNRQKKGFKKLYSLGCLCKVRESHEIYKNHYRYPHHLRYSSSSLHDNTINVINNQNEYDIKRKKSSNNGYCNWETKWDSMGFDCLALHSICAPAYYNLKNNNRKNSTKELDYFQTPRYDGLGTRVNYERRRDNKKKANRIHGDNANKGIQCEWLQSNPLRKCLKERQSLTTGNSNKIEPDLEREGDPWSVDRIMI